MNSVNSYGYVLVGICVRLFMNVDSNSKKGLMVSTIKMFKKELEAASFSVSLAFLNSTDFIKLEKRINSLETDSTKIEESISKELIRLFKYVESIVFSEATTKNIYLIPERRFNSDYLLNHPEKLLKDGTFDKLSEIARHDITSASRCILYGESTAAAFHILRATEDVLKSYYHHHRQQDRLDKPMWANMVDQLRAKRTKKPPAALLDSLDMVRNNYRNPTQHPKKLYDIDEAQDLFGVCLDVIGKMGAELS
jgi:hypothetical protein